MSITRSRRRSGFILYLVCALAFCLLILAAGLSRFKSGAVFQLARTIDQEKMIVSANAGISEMLARIKEQVNDPTSPAGKAVHDFWKKSARDISTPVTIWKNSYTASQLPMANQTARAHSGDSATVSGEACLLIKEAIGPGLPSYIGQVELVARAEATGYQSQVCIREHRDLKIVDLSDPVLDKYALFVKSFAGNLNDTAKSLIVNGIVDPDRYSYIYLGNRGYPACKEFPAGSRGAGIPPVLLDLDFIADRALLGGFYQPSGFATADRKFQAASSNQLFWVQKPPLDFEKFAGHYSVNTDFNKVPELTEMYQGLIDSCKPAADNQSSVAYPIIKEHQRADGKPENSKVFHSLLKDCFAVWKYHYGYSDYLHVTANATDSFTGQPPFSGILSYFEQMGSQNPQRLTGGRMPAFFGENRNICTYIEGPVYLRFFKLGFIDECAVKFSLLTGSSKIDFPAIPMRYESNAQTFSGKDAGQIDKMTGQLMSHPVELSINNFFFGAQENQDKASNAIGNGKFQGYEVFPVFDPTLTTAAHFYLTAGEFLKNRIKLIEGQSVLDLDGISIVAGIDGKALNLSTVSRFRGKGMIIMFRGNCQIGNLAPLQTSHSLRLYLMGGRFMITTPDKAVTIRASLVASTYFKDNAIAEPAQEGSLLAGGKDVHIIGNLVVDNLFDLHNCKYLKITHNPGLYFPDYPVRVSIGQVKSFYELDYQGAEQ